MALAFTGNVYLDSDYLPSPEEMKDIKDKIKRSGTETCSPVKRFKTEKSNRWFFDTFDEYGRNITEQEKRQSKVPWVRVKYVNGKLYIPDEKKIILRALNLI